MALSKFIDPQTDFSAGELVADMKRSDDPLVRTGARQCSNWRILDSKKLSNRPGRSIKFATTGYSRLEKVEMSPGNIFTLAFGEFGGSGRIAVFNAAGASVFTASGLSWTNATIGKIVWAIPPGRAIYITYLGMVPRVLTWDGVSTWGIASYAEDVINGQKRTAFYRISPQGITMELSDYTGAGVTATFSAGMNLVVGHVGTRLRYANRQVLITAVTDSTHATVTIEETIYFAMELSFGAFDPAEVFQVGDIVQGLDSVTQAVVVSFPGANKMWVQKIGGGLLTVTTATVVGPNGSLNQTGEANLLAPLPILIWDDEVMNSLNGYPASVFADQNRIGFCDFAGVPSGIAWSAIGQYTDLYPAALQNSAMFELVPNKSRVLYVQAGAESNEFVFCDNRVYYIPISVTNPLRVGSVQFILLSRDGAGQVQPRPVQEVILYVNAGLTSIMSIVASGLQTRPFQTVDISDMHSHLIKTPIAIAAPTTTDEFPERYAYIVNSDGTLAVLKYRPVNGLLQGVVGWVPWSGVGTVGWAGALNADVIFTTTYFGQPVCEAVDVSQYLDAAIPVNALPTALAAPFGKGPLWLFPSQSVTLIDLGTREMGIYQTDADGNIIPQNLGGEDLASVQLVAGQPWAPAFEPFIPPVQGGQSVGQRMKRRKISRWAVSFQNSTGFIAGDTRIPVYKTGENASIAPTQREGTETGRTTGRDFDPRFLITKDTSGPLIILEVATEVTV